MNLRIDPDASLLTASNGARRSGAAHADPSTPSTPSTPSAPLAEALTRPADRDETVLTSSRMDTTGQTTPLDDAAAAVDAGKLSQSQILAAPEAAVQAQANTVTESVLRLLQ